MEDHKKGEWRAGKQVLYESPQFACIHIAKRHNTMYGSEWLKCPRYL